MLVYAFKPSGAKPAGLIPLPTVAFEEVLLEGQNHNNKIRTLPIVAVARLACRHSQPPYALVTWRQDFANLPGYRDIT
jgi:hypothetical protein